MNTPLLQLDQLSIDFITENQTIGAIESIHFKLEKGKTIALVGESGSGKSVTAMAILQLNPSPPALVRSGRILFSENGKEAIDLLKIPTKSLEKLRGHKIGFIFQEPMTSLNPLMRCGDQVAEILRQHKGLNKKDAFIQVVQLFEEVKLPEPLTILKRYPHELSGGQKQRVMIAMAIACDPLLLIADEPTTALDVTVQKVILELLKELQQKKGMSILFITHDLNLVKTFADDVMVMKQGKCIEYGSCENIFSNPQEAYTRGLLACRPSSEQRVRFLDTVQDIMLGHSTLQHKINIIFAKDFNHRLAEMKEKECILELKDLQVWYPTKFNLLGKAFQWFKAVKGVNLTIHEGETLGLVGESGCGKTSIGKAIVKLAAITSGQILFKGNSIADFSKAELASYRKEIQMIFQDPYSSLNPRISVGAAIQEPLEVHGLQPASSRKDYVIELLRKVGLQPEYYQRYPHEFSGGQRQRICIARALALQSKLIICDESVSALDVSVQAQVLNLLVSLREEFGLSYLFISHDLAIVKHMSDRVAVMQNGKVIEEADAETLYRSPKHVYSQQLLQASF